MATKRRGLRAVDDPVAASAEPKRQAAPRPAKSAPDRRPPDRASEPVQKADSPKSKPASAPERETLFADIDATLKRRLDLAAVHLRLKQRELVELILREQLGPDDYVDRLRALHERGA